jgi:CheY-like chemotaxis protein
MSTKNKRFLIVDDQVIIRDFLKDLFLLYDLKFEEASNGLEAIAKWEHEDFNAILMDIEMPKMDGLQATRIIRRREQEEQRDHTPIFAISGYISNDPNRECSMAGVDGFIAKPVEVQKVLDCILPLSK